MQYCMTRRKMLLLLIVIVLCSQVLIVHATEDELYDKYYTVINNFVIHKTPMGAEWADFITRSILYYCAKWGVDPLLIAAVFANESSFNMAAYSSAGAIGIAQLMPDTAAAIGVNPNDPAQNIEGGIYYLAQQLSTFRYAGEWNTTYAVAAYNAGPNSIRNYGGVPPYAETINYVNAISRDYNLLNQQLRNLLN